MDYDFEKLARAITSDRLKDLDNAPAAAAEIASKIIISAVNSTQSRQDPHLTVAAVCRGVMSGILLIEKDLPQTAGQLLLIAAHLAQELHLDPQELMTWSMEGISDVAVLASEQVRAAIRDQIDEKFMGAGAVFGQLCDAAAARKAA